MTMLNYAHSLRGRPELEWEPLAEHLTRVAATAEKLADKFGAGTLGQALGLLHDLGKYAEVFQAYIRNQGPSPDHTTAGARALAERHCLLGKLLAYAVAGHQAGLANGVRDEGLAESRSPLEERLAKEVGWERALKAAEADGITLPADLGLPSLKGTSRSLGGFQRAFFGRMLFSCLVDADFLETERFYAEAERRTVERGARAELADLRALLDAHLAEKRRDAPDTAVNRLRADVLAHVREGAAHLPGVFTLTVPTGGGKTLTSLAFALDHAVRHGLERIVYVIPFTSIIEQTADVFRDALKPHERVILEHHSAFDEAGLRRCRGTEGSDAARDDDPERRMLRLAMENWDASVVVTTAVQFFESLFADRPSRCRKLHNLAKSVIILDEAQTLPTPLLRPCVAALDELARNYGSTVVLCTATQPALKDTAERGRTFVGGFDAKTTHELAPDPPNLFERLKRVTIEHAGVLSDKDLAGRLADAEQALCIVNTRAHARELYEFVKGHPGARHLSTLMCAAHRREVLAEIRRDLDPKNPRPCRVISTTLIEAGVDVDFPLVYRAEAGLDSIAQAAGRCNREGRRDWRESSTVVFEVEDKARVLKQLRLYADVGRRIVQKRKEDSLAPAAIENYFREVYWLKGEQELDRHGLLGLLGKGAQSLDLPFETVARLFCMIDDIFVPVIVPFVPRERPTETAHQLVETLRRLGALPEPVSIGGLARKLQPYTVGVPEKARAALIKAGAAEAIAPERYEQQFVWLTSADLYKPATGLDWSDPTFREASTLMT
jgi:CRISPR-associated endonuclease/helicase Cas3